MEKYKVVIIGGGVAGLSAAIYAARGGLNPLVFAGSPPGGQLMETSEVENFPGFRSILGMDLVEKIRDHAAHFGATIQDENISKVKFGERPFKLYIQGKEDNPILTDSVIIATGARARWLGLDSETRLRGKGVSACATCDAFFFKDKVVGVVGGGDTACEEALYLTKFAKEVYIIHRRDALRASKIMQDRVFDNPKITLIWNAEVEEVLGKDRVEGVKLRYRGSDGSLAKFNKDVKFEGEEDNTLHLDGLFVAIGHKPATEVFKEEIELDERGYIITTERVAVEYLRLKRGVIKLRKESSMDWEKIVDKFNLNYLRMSSVEGVFAAGDCADHIYQQASVASGSGVRTALEVERWLEENVKASK